MDSHNSHNKFTPCDAEIEIAYFNLAASKKVFLIRDTLAEHGAGLNKIMTFEVPQKKRLRGLKI